MLPSLLQGDRWGFGLTVLLNFLINIALSLQYIVIAVAPLAR